MPIDDVDLEMVVEMMKTWVGRETIDVGRSDAPLLGRIGNGSLAG